MRLKFTFAFFAGLLFFSAPFLAAPASAADVCSREFAQSPAAAGLGAQAWLNGDERPFCMLQRQVFSTCQTAIKWDDEPRTPFFTAMYPCDLSKLFTEANLYGAAGGHPNRSNTGHGLSLTDISNNLATYVTRMTEASCIGGGYIRNWYAYGPEYRSETFACPPLENTMHICVDGHCDTDTVPVSQGSFFALSWNAQPRYLAPAQDCKVEGQSVDRDEKIGEVTIGNLNKGIYAYTLTCRGILNGYDSLAQGDRTKTIKVNVGNVIAPHITSFSVTPDSFEKYGDAKEITASWSVENIDSVESISINDIPVEKSAQGSKALPLPGADKTYVLRVKGKWKIPEITASKTVTASLPGRPKVIAFKIEPAKIKQGESAMLSWEVQGAYEVIINQGLGKVDAKGSVKVYPTASTLYVLDARSRPDKNSPAVKASVAVRIDSPGNVEPLLPDLGKTVIVEPPAKIEPIEDSAVAMQPLQPNEDKLDLRVNGSKGPLTLPLPAEFELSWNVGRLCISHGAWFGIKKQAGVEKITVTKPGTYYYNMYCPGFPSMDDSIAVTVVDGGANVFSTPGVPMPVAEAGVSTDGITYAKSVRVVRGKPVVLWISADRDVDGDGKASRDESGGWSQMRGGGKCLINFDLNQGAPTFEAAADSPRDPSGCSTSLDQMVFNDRPGVYAYGVLRLHQANGKLSNIGTIKVIVTDPPAPHGPPVIDMSVNGERGSSITLGVPAHYALSWEARDADYCTASEGWKGEKPLSGTENFFSSVKKEVVYSLTCVGRLGTTASTVRVKIAEVPVCQFTALPATLDRRSAFIRQSELSWKCDFADSCSIEPAVVSRIKTFGYVRVSPSVSTTYTLTCSNADTSKSFEADVEVR